MEADRWTTQVGGSFLNHACFWLQSLLQALQTPRGRSERVVPASGELGPVHGKKPLQAATSRYEYASTTVPLKMKYERVTPRKAVYTMVAR